MSKKQVYNIINDLYVPGPEVNPSITEILPPVNFIVKCNKMLGFHLQHMEEFDLPEKIYGDVEQKAERIIRTYQNREGSTGVLLEGEKGSGKTMLAKLICKIANSLDMPVIVVSDNYSSTEFNQFIQSIKQPKIVLFDEFEKTFAKTIEIGENFSFSSQENLLTLLDGTMTNKTLYLFTCNDIASVSDKLLNRPGRIFYHITYDGLDDKFIEGYCMDNLNNKEFYEDFKTISILYTSFNFDILKALVEESNRYDESPTKFIDIINARPTSYSTNFNVDIFDECNNKIHLYPTTLNLNINYLSNHYAFAKNKEDYEKCYGKTVKLNPNDEPIEGKSFDKRYIFFLKKENAKISGGKLIIKNEYGHTAIFSKISAKKRFAFVENM